MIGSNLVYGGSFDDRLKFVYRKLEDLNFNKSNNPDFLLIEPKEDRKSIGIDEAKKIKEFLKEKPFNNKIKVVLIPKADLLTTEAQNSLLKILEEPPVFSAIFLCAKAENSVLPTILSRCKRNIVKDFDQEAKYDVKDVSVLNNADKLLYAEELSKLEREDIVNTLEQMIQYFRPKLIKPSKENINIAKNIDNIFQTIQDIQNTTVPSKLALEQLFFML